MSRRIVITLLLIVLLSFLMLACGANSQMWESGGAAANREEGDRSSMTIEEYCVKYPQNCDTSQADK